MSIITIDTNLSQPIYRQIIDSVYQAIERRELNKGDLLPSVNQIAADSSVARGSIFKAYNEMRTAGVIDSITGKGYFVKSTNYNKTRNIFLLLSTFNSYREVFYNAFINRLKNYANVDVYFHHHNIDVFDTLIKNHATNYNTFVIMPEINKRTHAILQQLDQNKIYILDAGFQEFGEQYPCVCQDYENDIYNFLQSHVEKIKKYQRVVLLFPDNIRAYGVKSGFQKFFNNSEFSFTVISDTGSFKYKKNDFCITMDDNDLVRLIHLAKSNNWKLGKDIGVVSYNETPLKGVIADGINTITTDFVEMGNSMADMILQNKRLYLKNPFLMIDRKSF